MAAFHLRTGTSRRNGMAVLAIECLRCCDGRVIGHVLEGRVCRGGGARELEPVGAAVLEQHVAGPVPGEQVGRALLPRRPCPMSLP